jgi:hypothetical protein
VAGLEYSCYRVSILVEQYWIRSLMLLAFIITEDSLSILPWLLLKCKVRLALIVVSTVLVPLTMVTRSDIVILQSLLCRH